MQQHNIINTVKLYDEDAYISEFDACVISCEKSEDNRYYVILDKTAFFPEGGGQPSDTGKLADKETGGEVSVIDVQEIDGNICHITEKPVNCGEIHGTIDFSVRYERMRNHSGEHILSGFAYKLYGCTNVGFHLNDDAVTVDFDKQLTKEELTKLEMAVNEVIAENVKISAYYPKPEELEMLEYRSKLDFTENVRIVEIGGNDKIYDRCACCAPHVRTSSEVGMLIITESMNYKGGTRLVMLCGKNAYRYSSAIRDNVREISVLLSSKYDEAAKAVSRYIQQSNEEKEKFSSLKNAFVEKIISGTEKTEGNIVFFEPQLDRNSLKKLVDKAVDYCGGLCAGFTGNDEDGWSYIIISRTTDLKSEAKSLNEKMSGKGGGSSQMLQGTAKCDRKTLEKIFM